MKKVFLSAIAMSLILMSAPLFAQTEAVDEFLGLESEVMPEMKGEQKFTLPELHDTDAWRVPPEKVEVDVTEPNKGQSYSITPWATQDPEEWLSISNWIVERDLKDKISDWKIRLRHENHKELVGKILQCRGECQIYRGTIPTKAQHLSQVLEGDELKTGKDSIAWIFMIDGSLLRLASDSSISMNEINLSKSEFFILARLNQGHVFWHPRNKQEMTPEFAAETDSMALPVMIKEANQQFYERALFKAQDDKAQLAEILNLDDTAIVNQTKATNDLKKSNNPGLTVSTKVMIVAPNASIVSTSVSFDFFYLPGGNSYFKKRDTELGEEFSLHLRGYSDAQVSVISNNDWHEVDSSGKKFQVSNEIPGGIQVLELLTRRIKTLELAREVWVKDFTLPLLAKLTDPESVAREFGYSMWVDENMPKRLNFLTEYTRRIETTNLQAMENLLTKLEGADKTFKRELSDEQYRESLKHYLLGLKSRYDKKKTRVKEMTDLQYYVWILKNGKF
jgi:hypothetical protein